MDLKKKIEEVLSQKKYTYAQLAKYLGKTEAELDHSLSDNSIEIRTLETISKELRISLYSFFRDPDYIQNLLEKEPFYITQLPTDSQLLINEIKELRAEIEKLRNELAAKEQYIQSQQTSAKK